VPEGDYARGDKRSAQIALSVLAKRMGMGMEAAAELILEISIKKILDIVEPMIKEYKLDRRHIILVGGGGGASVLIPYLAQKLKLPFHIAENAEVISSIGVATAMIHEEHEKTIDDPNTEDVSSLVEEVKQMALRRGASPESLIIQSEFIRERSILRATAVGSVSLDIGSAGAKEIDNEQARILACELFGINDNSVQRIYNMKNYRVFACEIRKKKLFLKSRKHPALVLDKYGRVRLSIDNATIFNGSPQEVGDKIDHILTYGSNSKKDNSEKLAPQVHILDGIKIVDFSSLTSPEHVSKAVREELGKASSKEVAAIVKL
jgi:N-methylhydantoinase A